MKSMHFHGFTGKTEGWGICFPSLEIHTLQGRQGPWLSHDFHQFAAPLNYGAWLSIPIVRRGRVISGKLIRRRVLISC
jgi:hypothetical protein